MQSLEGKLFNMVQSVLGKTVIITGIPNDIGKDCARQLALAGANIFAVGANEKDVKTLAMGISKGSNIHVNYSVCDRLSPDLCTNVIGEAKRFTANVDVLINCLDNYIISPALDLSFQELEEIFYYNLHSVFFMSQAFANELVQSKRSGTIINLTSVYASHSIANTSAYAASKAGLEILTKSLALEWGKYDIRVNGVASLITSPDWGSANYPHRNHIESRSPFRHKLVRPTEVADVIIYLCMENAQAITGQIITVDNGFTSNGNWV